MSFNPAIRKFTSIHAKEISLALVYILAYFPILQWMWSRWFATDTYYSHGILIPFVAAYLIWQKRDMLKKIPFNSSPWGIVLIIVSIVFYLFSALFRINFTGGLSMYLGVFGLVLYLYGSRVLKEIIFPISFLIFMFPLPEVAIVNISFRMKLFAAGIAEMILDGMGLSATRHGSIIVLKHTQVVVDDVCSGLRSLISLAALGSIFAYWLKRPMWKRIILFLATIPIAILTNVCRVVFLSFVSEVWGTEAASGFVHDFSGFAIFALAFVMMLFVSKLLE